LSPFLKIELKNKVPYIEYLNCHKNVNQEIQTFVEVSSGFVAAKRFRLVEKVIESGTNRLNR
jgi:hypothetical protein